MPTRISTGIFAKVFSTDVAIVTTTEKVVLTLPNISTGTPGASVWLHGWVQVTSGTGTTTVALGIRRGTAITDTLIGEQNAEQVVAAGDTLDYVIDVIDSPGEVASQSYVLTVTQAGATANGSALQGGLQAIVTG